MPTLRDPIDETKKDRIVATLRAFGRPTNKGALAEAINSSQGYIREFKTYEDISVNDAGGVIRHYHAEGYSHEKGDPPVVLQREPRSQSHTSFEKGTFQSTGKRQGGMLEMWFDS